MENPLPSARRETSLFQQFALGRGERRLSIVDAASRQLPHHRMRGVPILPLQQNTRFVALACFFGANARSSTIAPFIYSEHNNRSRMPNHITTSTHSTRFLNLVRRDAEHWTLIANARRDYARQLRLRRIRLRCRLHGGRFRHNHNIKVCCAGEPSGDRQRMPRNLKIQKATKQKPGIAIVGAGSLATFLAIALREAGFEITEIITRDSKPSLRKARLLAAKVGALASTVHSARLDATLLWFCVPDREIRRAASNLADQIRARAYPNPRVGIRFSLHSSGALSSRELDPLHAAGVAIASAHPLMTFVAGVKPSLSEVPFAVEGDAAAMRIARPIVRALGGLSFPLSVTRKAAYHAWATMTSPLLVAFLVALEEAASLAGLTREDARRKSLPIIMQTLANYSRLGPAKSFSGPLIRGDATTVAKHLAVLKKHPAAGEVYKALAQVALRKLPVKNRAELQNLLHDAAS